MKVVYAVMFSFEGGQPELDKLDAKLRDVLDAEFPDDPLLRLTRGVMVTMEGNPYPSAGFLHKGEVRVADQPQPVGRPPQPMRCTHKGRVHDASCVRGE